MNPYTSFSIRGRCSAKSAIRNYKNAKGDGKLFTFDLVDDTGEVRCTCFNESVDNFEPLVQVGNIYMLSKGSIKAGNPKFTKALYEITLNKNSVLEQITDGTLDPPKMRYAFVEIDAIQDLEVGTILDAIGVITQIDQLVNITSKKDQRELSKRAVILVDKSKRAIEMTFWGQEAQNFSGSIGDVLSIKNARVNEYQNSKRLNGINSTQIEINADIPIVKDLRKWYAKDSTKINAEAIRISGSSGGGSTTSLAVPGTLKQLKDTASEGGQEAIMRIRSLITNIKHDENTVLFYKSTPSGDNKKVIENVTNPGNGKAWHCPATNQFFDSYIPRYILSAELADTTDRIPWVTVFDDVGKLFLQCDATKVEQMREKDPKSIDIIFENAFFKRFVLKMKAKEETYNASSRIKYVIMNAEPINYIEESKVLLSEIKKFMKN
uniref:Replication protein A subunit n=1 Tax=Arcella intermedia TaxID=1963864 RepID=A0A6B2L476_9EUKA